MDYIMISVIFETRHGNTFISINNYKSSKQRVLKAIYLFSALI